MDKFIGVYGVLKLGIKTEKLRDRGDFLNGGIWCSVRLGKFW